MAAGYASLHSARETHAQTILQTWTTLPQLHQIHAQTIIHAAPICNHLLSKLADLQSPTHALLIFNHLSSPNDHSFTSLIRALVPTSPHHALLIYSRMLHHNILPTAFTFPFVLKAAAALPRLGPQVPLFLICKFFSQIFSFVNVQLFNSLLLRRECCSFSNGEYVKAGLAELEHCCYDATEEYAGSAWDELKHISHAVRFLHLVHSG